MPFVDFTTYTEVDPNNRFTVTTNKIDIVGLARNEVAYVYKDYGIDHFDGDFEHLSKVVFTSADARGDMAFTLANVLDQRLGMISNGDSHQAYNFNRNSGGSYFIYVIEQDGFNGYSDGYTPSPGTTYYLKFKRDESIGTYGTLYLYIYSDSSRTILLDTLSITLHTSKKNFRYYLQAQSLNTGHAAAITGSLENLDLQEAIAGNPYYYYAQQ